VVERSNLQRQVIHGDADVGEPKVESAARYVDRLNPDIDVETYETRLDEGNVRDLLAGYDLVVDCADNFRTRYVVNDAARIEGLPVVHGAIYKFEGQATTLVPDGPCYRCLFPEAPEPGTVPDCATTGVLGVLPGTVGCIQTTEAIKLLLDTGETLDGRVLFYDAMDMTFESVPYRRNPDCPVCGDDGIETIEGSTTRAGVASTRTDSQRPVRHRRPRGPVGPVVDEAGADAPAAVLVARPVRRAAVPTDDRLAVGVERGRVARRLRLSRVHREVRRAVAGGSGPGSGSRSGPRSLSRSNSAVESSGTSRADPRKSAGSRSPRVNSHANARLIKATAPRIATTGAMSAPVICRVLARKGYRGNGGVERDAFPGHS